MAAPLSGPIRETHPTSPAHAPTGISIRGFSIEVVKKPILKAGPIDGLTAHLRIPVPEMIFGDNEVEIRHEASGWKINFNTTDALDLVDKTGDRMLKVKHSQEWHATRQEQSQSVTGVVKPFDWSYTTNYRGTVTSSEGKKVDFVSSPDKEIPLALLKRPDPILFFDEASLYEDEMADNGITMYNVKVRVMPERLLLLARFFMRLDGVLFRIRDTRVYIDFESKEVIREYVERESEYEDVQSRLKVSRDDTLAAMRDPNKLSEVVNLVKKEVESLRLP